MIVLIDFRYFSTKIKLWPSINRLGVPVALAKIVSYVWMSGRAQQHFCSPALFAEEYKFKLIETIGQLV